jgi:HCOMODA/2-hydroxy-3-carboxy-muconic semialdehyde decarboxylase
MKRLALFLVSLAGAGFAGSSPAFGQGSAAQQEAATPVERAVLEDLVAASHILAELGVVDAFGHVSIRHPKNPNRFLMSRSIAPASTTLDDIVEHDLDGNGVDARGRALFLERFIHAEIYRRRPDVMAVVHSHSPSVIPFGVSTKPLLAMYHNAAFLAGGVPVFDIREKFGATDMLIRNAEIGRALAEKLGDRPVVLMRGHGSVATAPTLPLAVFRAYYTEVDARLYAQALGLGGPVNALTPEEGAKAEKVNEQIVTRAWDLWKKQVREK